MEIEEIKQRVLEEVDPPTRKHKAKVRRMHWLKTVLQFAGIIVAVLVVFRIVIGMSPVEGNSMYPTLHDSDTVFYSRLAKTYVRGDVAAIKRPDDEMFVKRVVAVAGDTVNIENGKLYINGKEQKEVYALGKTEPENGGIVFPVTVKDGEIFVLGDNRTNSEDSRMFGTVKIEDTKGKLLWYIGKL